MVALKRGGRRDDERRKETREEVGEEGEIFSDGEDGEEGGGGEGTERELNGKGTKMGGRVTVGDRVHSGGHGNKNTSKDKVHLGIVASMGLYAGYAVAVFLSLNILRTKPTLDIGEGSCASGSDPATCQIADAPTVALGMSSANPWPPAVTAIMVLLFIVLLLRLVAWAGRRIKLLERRLREAEEGSGRAVLGDGVGQDDPVRKSLSPSSPTNSRSEPLSLLSGAGDRIPLGQEIITDTALTPILVHEIRAPLKGLLGMLQLLLASSLDSAQQDFAQTMQTCTRSLLHLLGNILDLSNLDLALLDTNPRPNHTSAHISPTSSASSSLSSSRPGFLGIDLAPFELRSIIDEVLALFGMEGCEKGLELASLVMDSVPTAVVGDPVRLRQVLINLFAVSVRLTERGHVFLSVRLAPLEDGQENHRGGHPSKKIDGRGSIHHEDGDDEGENKEEEGKVGEEEEEEFEEVENSVEDAHAERSARGKNILEKGEFLTLSGREAVDAANSWENICGMMKEQEERFRKLMNRDEKGAGEGRSSMQKIRLVFTLEDTGSGIPGQVLERMRSPLLPLNPHLESRFSGVPILLAVSKILVQMMGGQLKILTRPGVGTTMVFEVVMGVGMRVSAPRIFHVSAGPLGDEQHPEFAANRAKLRGLRCLVVDGRPVRQQVTATYMARLGLRVDLSDSVTAAALALRLARQGPGGGAGSRRSRWDVVVVDADSDGEGTGIELGRMVLQLRDLKEAWEAPPVLPKLVLVAQATNEELEVDAGRHGFSCIMLKPLRASTMTTALLQALGLNHSESTVLDARRRQILLRLCLKAKKVMVVDHNFFSRKAAAITLSRFADAALAIESGEEAMRRLTPPHDFDLVLINLSLPDMPAVQMAKNLREIEAADFEREVIKKGSSARRFHVPLLGIVSDTKPEIISEWREADVDGLLTNPISEPQLLATVTRLFKSADTNQG